jgi:TatD DNase family protein
MRYIDFHTHRDYDPEIIQIRNVFAQDFAGNQPSGFFTVGLHPWHLKECNQEQALANIANAALSKNMLMIGECGLDKKTEADFAVQKAAFQKQIELAELFHRPFIIHCVKAYNELITLKKMSKPNIPWVIHGFNGNRETAESLLQHHFYFSIGERLLKNDLKSELLRMIPPNRLFLETDDQDISIQKIYFFAAQILGIAETELQEQIIRNFKLIFGDDKLVTKD